jgi:hypothetical protein
MAAHPRLKYATKFRDYQKSAIRIVRRYRDDFLLGGVRGAALVCHPTGTGKTAVIAGLALCCPEIGSVVVLTTREAVRDQLVRELSGNLFLDSEKFGLGAGTELSKAVFLLDEGANLAGSAANLHAKTRRILVSEELIQYSSRQFDRLVTDPAAPAMSVLAAGRAVLIMTVQMLGSLKGQSAQGSTLYESLALHADLVLFDEGHYEPAAEWSDTVRSLDCPLALLSATPFRNDLKPFQIAASNIDIYKYEDAWKSHFVRHVEVKPRTSVTDPNTFCEDIIDFCADEFGDRRDRWPRIIIHCDEKSRITRLGDAFTARGFSVIGIHERFPSKDLPRDWHRKKVPPPKHTDAKVWIHQYKLMEGIDDHQFRVLAFFDPMRNVRSIVQQIGRIIRRSPGERDETAYVLDHYRGRIAQYWSLYEDYDRGLTADGLAKSLTRFYLDAFIKEHPPVDYIDRKFRRRLIIEEVTDPADEILFPRRVTFKQIAPRTTIGDITDLVEKTLEIGDARFHKCLSTPSEAMYLYANISSPEFLQSRFFAEVRHGAKLIMLLPADRLLAFADTGEGSGVTGDLGALEPVRVSSLERLLSPGRHGRVTSVSSRNTNLGNRVPRRRSVSAPSVADVPPVLDEHGHILAALQGYNGDRARILDDLAYLHPEIGADFEDRGASGPQPDNSSVTEGIALIRRYIGLTSGHVSEVGSPLRIAAFREWIRSLAEQMKSGKPPKGLLGRFARNTERQVTRGTALNLLLDLYEVQDAYVHESTNEPLTYDELCVQRDTAGTSGTDESHARFLLKLNGENHPIDVVFYKSSQRYRLESESLDKHFVSKDSELRVTLTRAINDRQLFNVIPDDLDVIYVHGRFYAPGLKFGSRFDAASFFVGQCLYPSPTFKERDSEKGRCVVLANGTKAVHDGDDYDPDSVFGLIDSWQSGFSATRMKVPSTWGVEFSPERIKFNPTLVICDDMGNESADFILADEQARRVVLVHAKGSTEWRPFSASAVQEVCAQAQKNTALFSLFSLQKPGNFSRWGAKHSFKGSDNVSLSIRHRIRKPRGLAPTQVWSRLQKLLLNPQTDREVWLVLGNMLSADGFHKNLQENEPEPEALQLNHLLQTTIAAVGSVGAKLRIFCAP